MHFDRLALILRATSYSGKTTYANWLKSILGDENCVVATADDYFIDLNGIYNFDAKQLGAAHNSCRNKFEEALKNNVKCVISANTNCSEAEVNVYVGLAKKYSYPFVVTVLEKRHDNKNSHNLPVQTLLTQENKLRNSIKL